MVRGDDEHTPGQGCKLQAISSAARAENAVSLELSGDKPSLIADANTIAKLGLVRDEGRRGNGVALRPFVTYVANLREAFRYSD
jgi:hypothetical protein